MVCREAPQNRSPASISAEQRCPQSGLLAKALSRLEESGAQTTCNFQNTSGQSRYMYCRGSTPRLMANFVANNTVARVLVTGGIAQ